jgi:hypothetical protein
MFSRHKLFPAFGLLSIALATASIAFADPAADTASADAPAGTPASEGGSWQPHSYEFHFMGFTSTYSCDGLADTLKLLLRLSGAREDLKVDPLCARGYGVPDKLVQATVAFSTLKPASPASAGAAARDTQSVDGNWRHVEISPRHPFDLQTGDCELIEEFRDTLLPMFATRNVNSQVSCVPHQESGSNFSLSFDVFAPLPKAKAKAKGKVRAKSP